MKTTSQLLTEVRKLHAHQGPKVVKAYVLMACRAQFGIREIEQFKTFAWASYCWDNKLGPTYKPFLIQ